jgi:hypothetical protein
MRVLVFGWLAVLGLAMAGPARAEEASEPAPHADEVVEAAFERYETDIDSDDPDVRLRIVRWLGMHRHARVVKELQRLWLREKDPELKAAAAEGLGNQASHAKKAAAALLTGLEEFDRYASRTEPIEDDRERMLQAMEAKALAQALAGLARLGHVTDRKGWKVVRGFIDHPSDEICIAMLEYCRAVREWRALPMIHDWFTFYPDGHSWSGGSVVLPNGTDAEARAKWMAKYGGRARRARPRAHAAMKDALKAITGQDFEKPEELKAWMKENDDLLRKHGV